MIHEASYNICMNVIMGCETREQLQTALEYAKLYMKKLNRDSNYSGEMAELTRITFQAICELWLKKYRDLNI